VSDYYHDDPVEQSEPRRKIFPGFVAFLLFVFAGGSFLQTTLAANITLNSGPITFGQGIAQTTACSNGDSLIVTPRSSFTNTGDGFFAFTGVTVSDIPASCHGVDFVISVYNTTGDALAIFNTSSTVARIWNDAGTFKLGTGSVNGASITSNTGAFTFSFTTPVALASNVSKVTLQSSAHAAYNCALELICEVGDTGPGGGKIFYRALTPFACGLELTNTCTYMESAPISGTLRWDYYRGSFILWSGNTNTLIGSNAQGTAIGTGYKNTFHAYSQSGANVAGRAIKEAWDYVGPNGLTDWYLPARDEMNALLVASSSVPNLGFDGSGHFWNSTEASATSAGLQFVSNRVQTTNPKSNGSFAYAIRAF
jgi:hypothetical protein